MRSNDGPRLAALTTLVSETPELREAYGELLSGLRLAAPLQSGNAVLVTSAQPNEGKTTVAAGLAIAAALAGQAALLVDGDLRRPSLSRAAGIANGVGLTDLIGGTAQGPEAVHRLELFEGVAGAGALSVMTAGSKPAAFLPTVDRTQARAALRSLAAPFDIVLMDSPPILAANDALLLAGMVDGVLLVVGAGEADRRELQRVKAELEEIGAPLLGAVLNRFDPKRHGRSTQPYRGYYLDRRA